MRNLTKALLGVVISGVIVLLWFILQLNPLTGSGKPEIITVKQGDGLSQIATELHQAGIIASPLAFRIDALLQGSPIVQPGSYQIDAGSSFGLIRSIISSAPNVEVVDVVPGLTLHEVALDVANAAGNNYAEKFLRDLTSTSSNFTSGDNLEGLIGPGRFLITPQVSPSKLVTEMIESFNHLAAKVGLTPSTRLNGLDAYQLITAASIVEKEGYYPSNMPKVARVIFNRLARGGSLQMDATVLYALGQDGGTVTPSMLKIKSPYNTYLSSGLTPTPICVVSSFSLDAILHAPEGPWLYFEVIDKSGDEAFSTTFAQQLANERLAASRGL